MHQVDLPEVRSRAEPPDVEEVLIRCTGVRIPRDSEVFDKLDRVRTFFAKCVLRADVNADDLRSISNFVLHLCAFLEEPGGARPERPVSLKH